MLLGFGYVVVALPIVLDGWIVEIEPPPLLLKEHNKNEERGPSRSLMNVRGSRCGTSGA